MILLTDVPGIKKDSQWLQQVSLTDIKTLINEKVITGGMLPKLVSAKKALMSGVATVSITDRLEKNGTQIRRMKETAFLQ